MGKAATKDEPGAPAPSRTAAPAADALHEPAPQVGAADSAREAVTRLRYRLPQPAGMAGAVATKIRVAFRMADK